MKYFMIFVVFILVVSLTFGLFVTYDKKYITDNIFVFEYSNLNSVGDRMVSMTTNFFNRLKKVRRMFSKVLKFGVVEIDTTPYDSDLNDIDINNLTRDTKCCFLIYDIDNSVSSLRYYLVWVGTGYDSYSYVIASNDDRYNFSFGRRIEPVYGRGAFSHFLSYVKLFDSNNTDYMRGSDGKVVTIPAPSSFYITSVDPVTRDSTIGDVEEYLNIKILDD